MHEIERLELVKLRQLLQLFTSELSRQHELSMGHSPSGLSF
jgi:hypothetical protein